MYHRSFALATAAFVAITSSVAATPCETLTQVVQEILPLGPLAKKTEEGFSSSPHHAAIDEIYDTASRHYFIRPESEIDDIWRPYIMQMRQNLTQDLSRAHPVGLERLGFKFMRQASGQVNIVPPADLKTIFVRHAQVVDRWIAERKLAEGDHAESYASLLAIPTFNRKTGKYQFIAPGIDPWPEDYEVATSVPQFTHLEFYRAIANGRFPIVFDTFFLNHDLSHVTSKGDSAAIMRETIRYARQLLATEGGTLDAANAHPTTENIFYNWPLKPASPMRERSSVIEEWLFLPDTTNPQKSQAIARLVAQRMSIPDLTVAKVKEQLKRQASFQDYLKTLLDAKPLNLLVAHGGGARDGMSTNLMFYTEGRLARYVGQRIAFDGAAYSGPPLQTDIIASRETLVGLVREIEFLYQLRFDQETFSRRTPLVRTYYPDDDGSKVREQLLQMDPIRRNLAVDALLIESVARLEVAFVMALRTGITPEQVYIDARVDAPGPSSPTFQYFASIYEPGSLNHYAFDLGR